MEKLKEQDLDAVRGTIDDEDEPPKLSSHALAALNEFLREQSSFTEDRGAKREVELVAEDWRLSQFWYDPETARTIAQEVLSLCRDADARVACIACPTLYSYLKSIDPTISVQLLEYDKRFEQYGSDFTFYDYNQPEELPLEMNHAFQIVVADPPYLVRCKGIGQLSYWVCTLVTSGLGIRVNSETSSACLQTMTQGRGLEAGNKRYRHPNSIT